MNDLAKLSDMRIIRKWMKKSTGVCWVKLAVKSYYGFFFFRFVFVTNVSHYCTVNVATNG